MDYREHERETAEFAEWAWRVTVAVSNLVDDYRKVRGDAVQDARSESVLLPSSIP